MLGRSRAGLIVVLLLACAATPARAALLVTPQDRPIGGQWQRWTNESRMPTYRGVVQLVPASVAFCGDDVLGCAEAGHCPLGLVDCAANGAVPVIAVGRRDEHWTLLHELGHEFDWAYLTGRERERLLVLMGDAGQPWREGGAQDDFANLYATCAEGYGRRGWPYNTETGDGWPVAPTLADLNATCALIVRLGPRQHVTRIRSRATIPIQRRLAAGTFR
jgi:hypothetical protein